MNRHVRVGTITTRRNLLSSSWTADVEALETAIERFKTDGPSGNDCQIVFFEIPRDQHLHVNVRHNYSIPAQSGWAGPASVAGGFVHNRTFSDTSPSRMIRQIRDMVFADRM